MRQCQIIARRSDGFERHVRLSDVPFVVMLEQHGALLNRRGGHVLFGVAPDGRVVGQRASEGTIERIGAEVRRIDPPALPEIARIRVSEGLEVIAVQVHLGASAPKPVSGCRKPADRQRDAGDVCRRIRSHAP